MSKAPRKHGSEWTPRNDQQLRKLARENTPTRVIGLKLGRTPNAVHQRVSRKAREIDHATSLANGGSHTLRNFRNLCGPCNRAKGRRNRRDFVRTLR